MTHTSGVGYDTFNPLLTAWAAATGKQDSMFSGSLVSSAYLETMAIPI
jgi:hypothetical protein